MKKSVLFLLCFLTYNLRAQDWLGLITDNYAGVHAIHVQPASVVSSPYKYDINIVGLQFKALNASVFETIVDLFNEKPLSFLANSDEFAIVINGQLPSILYKINEKSAFGFEVKVLANMTTEASDDDLLNLVKNDFDDPRQFGRLFDGGFVTGRSHVWWEFGGTYGRRIYSDRRHQLNGGITLKYILGTGGGYLNLENLSFTLQNADSLVNVSARVQFVYNQELDDLINDGKVDLFSSSSLGGFFWIGVPVLQGTWKI